MNYVDPEWVREIPPRTRQIKRQPPSLVVGYLSNDVCDWRTETAIGRRSPYSENPAGMVYAAADQSFAVNRLRQGGKILLFVDI